MTTSNPHRHIKKRLIKTVGAHTLCSCGYIQNGGLYFYIKDYQGNVRVVLNQANFVSEADAEKVATEVEQKAAEERKSNYSAPPQNIGYAVKLAIKSWQV